VRDDEGREPSAELMGAALLLAGDASALATSTSLLVDGGWTVD